jgi:glyoxylase-like metal-dependent hydrolase (beta-lactamase superfamily II)
MKQIAKDVFQISVMPRNSINCYLIEDVLIDAGIRSSGSKILKEINGFEVNKHAITHAHADHQGASREICEQLKIPFLCGEKDKIRAESGFVTQEYSNQNSLITKFQQRFWAGMGYKVSQTLNKGDKIAGFTVIETPGHATGHISFFREFDGILIVGDVMTNMNLLTTFVGLHEPPAIFTTNQELNRKSILKLADLDPKILCFGHGPVLFDKGELKKFIRKIKH